MKYNVDIYTANNIPGNKSTNPKKCNMVDVNPESSISGSNSNSMISKTPTSSHTLAGDLQKDEHLDPNRINETEKTGSCLTIPPGCKM